MKTQYHENIVASLMFAALVACLGAWSSTIASEPDEPECLVIDAQGEPVRYDGNCFDVNRNGVVDREDLGRVKTKLIANINGIFFYEFKDMLGDFNRKPYLLNGRVLWIDFEDMQIIECELIRLRVIEYNGNPACLIQP